MWIMMLHTCLIVYDLTGRSYGAQKSEKNILFYKQAAPTVLKSSINRFSPIPWY